MYLLAGYVYNTINRVKKIGSNNNNIVHSNLLWRVCVFILVEYIGHDHF